jgi:hypothetical protein
MAVEIVGLRRQGEKVEFLFSDKAGLEFASLEAARTLVQELSEDTHLQRKLAIAAWLAKDPRLENDAFVKGKVLSLDLTAASPVEVKGRAK